MNEQQNGSVTRCSLIDAQQAMIITVNVTISKENTILEDDHAHFCLHTALIGAAFVCSPKSNCLTIILPAFPIRFTLNQGSSSLFHLGGWMCICHASAGTMSFG